MHRLGIVAGDGRLPLEIRAWCEKRGIPFEYAQARRRGRGCAGYPLAALGRVVRMFGRRGIDRVVLAGGVRGSRIGFSWLLVKFAWKLLFMRNRYDGVLRLVIGEFEKAGMSVVSVQDIMPRMAAGKGVMTKTRPSPQIMGEIRKLLPGARAFAATDRGQSVVALGGKIMAKEKFDGTDKLLNRRKAMRGAILIKVAKPFQDLRADAPVIGFETVKNLAKNGFAGAAVEAGKTIITSRAETLRLANRLGLFIVGV
ncbi:MAG: UDP-2,3-diacylglucosamine diphosphatase LpxI [Rickettsiales bacterium]|jgi:DUF1009 family protein|nr:UDP-2,3-diacylglucosamine diphosphatase LpxI [Rickettsiales bacterium]